MELQSILDLPAPRNEVQALNPESEAPNELIQRIRSEAEAILRRERGEHSLQHAERVLKLSLRIRKEEGDGDPLILQAAAILHDIAAPNGRRGHAERSAMIAEEILEKTGFPEEKRRGVIHAIETHRFSDHKKPDTAEAKILQDADRLDAIGAIGLARCFAYGGRRSRPLYDPSEMPGEYNPEKETSSLTHIQEKLLKIRRTLHTETARKIAEDRHRFMLQFIKRLDSEIKGEK
jgi:uncharacterized protein